MQTTTEYELCMRAEVTRALYDGAGGGCAAEMN